MHAELKIGSGRLMLADEFPSFGSLSPKTLGGSPVVLESCTRKMWTRCSSGQYRQVRWSQCRWPDQFWGDRYGQITDPSGHRWALGQHVEDVSPEEMERRAKEAFAANGRSPQVSLWFQ